MLINGAINGEQGLAFLYMWQSSIWYSMEKCISNLFYNLNYVLFKY